MDVKPTRLCGLCLATYHPFRIVKLVPVILHNHAKTQHLKLHIRHSNMHSHMIKRRTQYTYLLPIVINWHNIHYHYVLSIRVQSRYADLYHWEHSPVIIIKYKVLYKLNCSL